MMKKSNDLSPLGIYLHIPFCRKKCLYCDFCSYPNRLDRGTLTRYTARLCDELTRRAHEGAAHLVDSIYFGGGTPTLLSPEDIGNLLSVIRQTYTVSENAEITVECNPATTNADALRALRAFGVNRLSIGMQSASDEELHALGRIHTFADTQNTIHDAQNAGFENLSLDLMYGIPMQTPESFRHTLDAALAFAPTHISAYSLIVEEGTPFYEKSLRGQLSLPDEDDVVAMTDTACAVLHDAGLFRYEISNFARPGRESRHNLHYWQMDDYLGVGIAAHSLIGDVRTGHSRDLDAYLRGENTLEAEETLTNDARREEYVMLFLRLAAGIEKAAYKRRFGESFDDRYGAKLKKYLTMGLLTNTPERIAFTNAGFHVCNTVLSDILDFR